MDGETTERVHAQLKNAVMTGAVSMHVRIDLAEIAALYDVSTTPVREAAMRLWGEGLLEPHPKGGLRAVPASETRLRAMLDLNGSLAETFATSAADISCNLQNIGSLSIEVQTRGVFRMLAERSGNPMLVDIIERLSDRLALYRQLEPGILGTAGAADVVAIRESSHDRASLRKALRCYHRRRVAHAAELVWAATAGGTGQPA